MSGCRRSWGPPLGPCSAKGFSGLLRVAGVSPPIDGEVDAQEGAGHHIPPLVNDRAGFESCVSSWREGAVCLSLCMH